MPYTGINTQLYHGQGIPPGPMPGITDWTDQSRDRLSTMVQALFGNQVKVTDRLTSTVPYAVGTPHNLTGLPYLVSGLAIKQSQEFAQHLSTMDNPIHAIFATKMYHARVIIVTKKGYKGGHTGVIPEHGQGKTMVEVEEEKKVVTQRIGNDFEMNLNLFLEPAEAKKKLDEIVRYQQTNMENAIILEAWDTLFKEGTPIDMAMAVSNTTISMLKDEIAKVLELDRIAARGTLFAISKNRFGLENLKAIIDQITIASPSGTVRKRYELLAMPRGFLDYRVATPDTMYHYISGLPHTDTPKKLKINNGIFSFGGMRVVEYEPIPDARSGSTIHPTYTSSPFESVTSLGMFYVQKDIGYDADTEDEIHNSPCIVTNFVSGDWSTLPTITFPGNPAAAFADAFVDIRSAYASDVEAANLNKHYVWWSRPNATFKGQNIVAVADPGPNTGEIVIQWPKLDIMTNARTEILNGAIRAYSKSYLKHESNVLVIKNARISGCLAGGGANTNMFEHKYTSSDDLVAFITTTNPSDTRKLLEDPLYIKQCKAYNLYPKWFGSKPVPRQTVKDRIKLLPVILYRGTMLRAKGGIRCDNQGALGVLDHPANVDVVRGLQKFADVIDNYRGSYVSYRV